MKILLSFSLFLISTFTYNIASDSGVSGEITICHTPATESFAALAADASFVSMHETPTPLVFQAENGKNITFSTADGREGNGFEIKAAAPTDKYLFVIHEWWGLNDHIKKQAQKLYKDLGNINVIALDLYDGEVTDNPQQAGKLMGGVKTARAEAIINGAIKYVGSSAKVYTIGWCFGGGWSLQASLLLAKQAQGCVIYYGMPEKDVERLKNLQTDVLGIWATERWINKDIITAFENNMKDANKQLASHTYKSAHAFANPSQRSYNSDDAADAYAKTLAFFKERMQ